MTRRRLAALALSAGALVVALAAIADARPGGGHSYSGGSDYGGGGGGGDGDASGLIYLLIHLIVEVPYIGIPLAIIVFVLYIKSHHTKKDLPDWDTSVAPVRRQPPDLARVRTLDPNFSIVLFEDFVYRLFAQAMQARQHPQMMDALAPYLAESVRTALLARNPQQVIISNVVIGTLRVTKVDVPSGAAADDQEQHVNIELHLTYNYTADMRGKFDTYYAADRWWLARGTSVQSKPPDGTRTFDCPNCGAPFQSSDGQTCQYCDRVVTNGRFDWMVMTTNLVGQEALPPSLTGTVEERGTHLPTIVHPDVDNQWRALVQSDPQVSQEALGTRLSMIYYELNRSWTSMDLAVARPYVSDGLFDYLRYWVEAYHRQGLRNVLENMRCYHWAYARITRDAYYDALTVRIWATGRDYTVDAKSGTVVGGHKGKDRDYTEYWTLIRRANVRGVARSDKQCPNCGAPMAITMGGECEHCNVHVTAGEFDWVLSKIEQDDSYRG